MLFLFTTFIVILISPFNQAYGTDNYSIVFIHIGEELPSYLETSLTQARAFNKTCPIILVANQSALDNYPLRDIDAKITTIACESLKKTKNHIDFQKSNTLQGGFWRNCSERFLYLDDLMNDYGLQNVFHLEYDNMLYVNLGEILPVFLNQYKGIAATFDNDQRCIPGFIFIPNKEKIDLLAKCFVKYTQSSYNDMQVIAIFKKQSDDNTIDHLPIVSREYVNNEEMISPYKHIPKDKYKYCLNVELFGSIFDAAAIGQYLGGTHVTPTPGFINESCVFNPSQLTYEWLIDGEGRKVPFACYANKKYRINNLHIHSKNLSAFSSLNTNPL